MKIVCDASSLISLSENCLLWILPPLRADFVVPQAVKKEIVDNPLHTTRFELKAIRLNAAIKEGTLKVEGSAKVSQEAQRLSRLANSLFSYKNKPVKILHGGEAESLALLKTLDTSTFLIDERTCRLIVEDLSALHKYMQQRMNVSLRMDKRVADELEREFSGINVVRSSELVAYAYEKGLFKGFMADDAVLHAILFAVKFSGCAISEQEIRDYLQIMKK